MPGRFLMPRGKPLIKWTIILSKHMNNSTVTHPDIPVLTPDSFTVPPSYWRSRHALELTLSRLFKLHAAVNVLLITATFPVQITRADAMHRFEKLLRKLRKVSTDYLWVFERGSKGHVHFHLLLPVPFNVQEGVDLERFASIASDDLVAKRKLLNKPTRDLEKQIRGWCENFGIGRTEVAPLYRPPEGISKYLLKSALENRIYRKVDGGSKGSGDKGARWWSCSRDLKAVHGRFSFANSTFRKAVK